MLMLISVNQTTGLTCEGETADRNEGNLNWLRRTMYGCTGKAKVLAYLALVRSCLEYCSVVWTLHTSKNIELIESVQRRAPRWIKSSFDPLTLQWTKTSSECIRAWMASLAAVTQLCLYVLLYAIINNFTPINYLIIIDLMNF